MANEFPRFCKGRQGPHLLAGPEDITPGSKGGCRLCYNHATMLRLRRMRGTDENNGTRVLFTGPAHEWGKGGGSTGADHPFRRKSQKAFDRHQREVAEQAELNSKALESFGISVDMADQLEPLETLDRFVEANRLEHAGVDRVLSRFERARFDHHEEDEG